MEYQLGYSMSNQRLAQPSTNAPLPKDGWKAHAITTYREHRHDEDATLRVTLADRVLALTGSAIEEVWVDHDERVALTLVDGVLFRYAGEHVTLLRPCALCGSGHFASPPVTSLADAGYALSAWQPRHPECQPDDPVNWLDDSV